MWIHKLFGIQRPVTAAVAMVLIAGIVCGQENTDRSSSADVTPSAVPKAKVLFIGKQPDHPYGSHMYLHTGGVLAEALKNEGLETVVSDQWPEQASLLEDVDAIVVYTSPAAELLLDGPHREAFDSMMQQGVGLVTLHWASSIFQQDLDRLGPRWLNYLGGTWVSNVGLHTGDAELRQLQQTHPICRGWTSYELHDEYYLNPTIDAAQPLLEVSVQGQPVTVAWTHQRADGGRSFATTLGHFYRNFQREPFRKMVVNGILWAADVEVPANGADVRLSETSLALPPKPGD
ncbi:ThuA domain-containing protein [Roseiconus nitratireducens]|nr:ThuA domain-containing protein [Roseiconus nitratireducens]